MSEITDYQARPNGPLKPEIIEAINMARAKHNLSYKALGNQLNISGAFAYNVLNKNMNITTNPYMYKMAPGITALLRGEKMPVCDVDGNEADKHAGDTLEHSYQLRKDLTLKLSLPADLTDKEASRLALFIQSLPH